MHYHCRLLPYICVYEEAYTKKNERYAQPLAHIQNHILLESHLRLFDELYEETHSEASDEKCSDEESPVELRQPVLVHQDLENSQKEVAQGFIKLSRMFWFGLAPEFDPQGRFVTSPYISELKRLPRRMNVAAKHTAMAR